MKNKALLILIAALWVVGFLAVLWRPSLSVAAGGPFTVLTVGTPTGSCANGLNSSAVCVNGSAVGGGATYKVLHSYSGTGNPVCTASSGSNPSADVYAGSLTGAATPALPSSGCINQDEIIYDVTQGGGGSLAPTGTINVSSACTLGSTTGNEVYEIFNWNSGASGWSETCAFTIPSVTNVDVTQTVSGATSITPSATLVTGGVLTFSASATVTINAATYAHSYLNLGICQNGTGGFTPTIAFSGVTLTDCTLPTFTTTASKCGDLGLYFTTTSVAYCVPGGYAAGPF